MKFFKRHKILTALLLVVLLFGLAAAWFIWDKLDRIDYHDGTLQAPVQSVQAEDAPEEEAAPPILTEGDLAALPETETVLSDREIEETEDVFNILLLGTDERADGYSENARADSIMLLSVDKKNAGLRLVSLQRGMGVPILEGEYEGSYDWLTHCFRYGGADLMLKEVQHCLRVEVDRYVRVNFDSFRQVIDAVGGVEITLTAAEAKALDLQEGANHLDGTSALRYARLRSIDDDWYRIQRQRNVIQSVVHSAKGLNLLQLNEAANEILPLIQTNLTKSEMLDLILFAPQVLGADLEQMSLPAAGTYGGMTGLGGRVLYAVDFDANAEILHDFLYGEEE